MGDERGETWRGMVFLFTHFELSQSVAGQTQVFWVNHPTTTKQTYLDCLMCGRFGDRTQ